VLAGVLVYSNSLSGPFVYDDQLSIVENRYIRQLSSPSRLFFPERELPVAGRPLVNVSFAINYAIGGLEVRGYHVWNVAIHILCALLLFGVVRRTLDLPRLRSVSPERRPLSRSRPRSSGCCIPSTPRLSTTSRSGPS
jgi:hypothetical protein